MAGLFRDVRAGVGVWAGLGVVESPIVTDGAGIRLHAANLPPPPQVANRRNRKWVNVAKTSYC